MTVLWLFSACVINIFLTDCGARVDILLCNLSIACCVVVGCMYAGVLSLVM